MSSPTMKRMFGFVGAAVATTETDNKNIRIVFMKKFRKEIGDNCVSAKTHRRQQVRYPLAPTR
jgi:hypothetical protein